MKQYLKEFTHNAIVHPLMMFLPSKIGRFIHNANAEWAFKERYDEMYLEGRKTKSIDDKGSK